MRRAQYGAVRFAVPDDPPPRALGHGDVGGLEQSRACVSDLLPRDAEAVQDAGGQPRTDPVLLGRAKPDERVLTDLIGPCAERDQERGATGTCRGSARLAALSSARDTVAKRLVPIQPSTACAASRSPTNRTTWSRAAWSQLR